MRIIDEIEKLEKIKSEYEVRAARRNRMMFTTAWALFATQFGVSYYCIYEVDWLGWDLVEPITYSFGQGLFVAGMFYSLKHLG